MHWSSMFPFLTGMDEIHAVCQHFLSNTVPDLLISWWLDTDANLFMLLTIPSCTDIYLPLHPMKYLSIALILYQTKDPLIPSSSVCSSLYCYLKSYCSQKPFKRLLIQLSPWLHGMILLSPVN